MTVSPTTLSISRIAASRLLSNRRNESLLGVARTYRVVKLIGVRRREKGRGEREDRVPVANL